VGAVATARVVALRAAVDIVSGPCALPEVHEGASFRLGAAGLARESTPTLERAAKHPVRRVSQGIGYPRQTQLRAAGRVCDMTFPSAWPAPSA